MKNITQYYHELAKLAYALVLTDSDIHFEDRRQLRQFIAEKMSGIELIDNNGHVHKANALEFDFSKMDQKQIDPLHALISFKNFIGKNFEEHDEAMIQKGMHFLETVSAAYNRQKTASVSSSLQMAWTAVEEKIDH